jgi:hypothetical protein
MNDARENGTYSALLRTARERLGLMPRRGIAPFVRPHRLMRSAGRSKRMRVEKFTNRQGLWMLGLLTLVLLAVTLLYVFGYLHVDAD